MKRIHVGLRDRSYSIFFGPIVQFPPELKRLKLLPTKILVITTKSVERAGILKKITRALPKVGAKISLVVLPDGESQKNFRTLEKLYKTAVGFGMDRQSLVIGLGGGVITDLAGF